MIYVDSCILIYALENGDDVGERARSALTNAAQTLAISPLVIHEALIGPMRARDAERQARMESAFTQFELLPFDLSVFVRAAELRATHRGLRAPDAIHLAAARLAGCTALWTNDGRLAAASHGLAVDIIGD